MGNKYPPAIFLMGATATGKTALAIELVNRYPCEIISVDSALIYQGLDIGTAKPNAAELEQAPHFLIDIIQPQHSYSAWKFRHDAIKLMAEISARGNIPLLVGATMLYFNALEFGMDDLPQSNAVIRKELLDYLNNNGIQTLYKELESLDPSSANKIKATDKQRIMRALEVYRLTGKPLSELQTHTQKSALDYAILKIILAPEDRKSLHQRITERFDLMLEHGFINEVKQLKQNPNLSLEHASMRCVGYRQVWQYLDNEYDFNTMKDKAYAATRQLAKRQITWLRKQQNAHCFASDALDLDALFTFFEKNLSRSRHN